MSVTRPLDGWDRNAAKLLRRRILEGSPDKAVNYAPDASYDRMRMQGSVGPLTVQINEILQRHAALWAQAMREEHGGRTVDSGRAEWLLAMREADAEIKRFLAGHKLTTGAAA